MTVDSAYHMLQLHIKRCDICMAAKVPSEYCNAGFSLVIAMNEADRQTQLNFSN